MWGEKLSYIYIIIIASNILYVKLLNELIYKRKNKKKYSLYQIRLILIICIDNRVNIIKMKKVNFPFKKIDYYY